MFQIRFLIMALTLVVCIPVNATPLDFSHCDSIESNNKARACHATARGLSNKASWDEIGLHDGEKIRELIAEDLKLPVTASWDMVIDLLNQHEAEREANEDIEKEKVRQDELARWEDQNRRSRAIELGLSADSSWQQINDRASDLERQTYAKENRLPGNSSWEAIQRAAIRKEIAYWKSRGIIIYPSLTKAEQPIKKKPVRKRR